SAATIVGGLRDDEKLQQIAKPLIGTPLAVRVLRRARDTDRLDTALLLAGLAAATAGDVFMIRSDDDRRLLRGASSFAVMQAAYSTLLVRRGARPSPSVVAQRAAAVLGAAGLLGAKNPSVAAPLTGYGTLLATTATLAADPALVPGARQVARMVVPGADRRSWPALGGLAFTVSDGTIVLRRTLLKNETARAAAEGFVLVTYAAAQLMLVEGMLALARRD
ncbi:lysoplasmalogenase family protein, partial [Rhodococcus chondri]